jgi:prevent-host-death family protein
MDTETWTVAQAKAKFVEIIERAISEGPQTITRKGRAAAIVVGAEEWRRKTKHAGNLAEFFAASPLRGSRLKIRRLDEHDQQRHIQRAQRRARQYVKRGTSLVDELLAERREAAKHQG